MSRPKVNDRNLTVRVPEILAAALEADASEHGRTVAQSVRAHLETGLGLRRGTGDPPIVKPPKPRRPATMN